MCYSAEHRSGNFEVIEGHSSHLLVTQRRFGNGTEDIIDYKGKWSGGSKMFKYVFTFYLSSVLGTTATIFSIRVYVNCNLQPTKEVHHHMGCTLFSLI